ncbi:hypothetical protein BKA70DRAFT_773936 [Coprinopsis sp. MPI-PUGE-AT-0042]|nr:hypothetical protein BKA70DRAFT_773936 [Coprinopsis sp. MPI-PUGE-AT-0042]
MDATIQNTIGALEIGSLIATFLFGALSLQVHTYFSKFKSDRAVYKGIIIAVWFLDLVQTVIIAVLVYRTTIEHYGAPVGTPIPYPELGVSVIVGACLATVVQCFFSYRVWLFLPATYRYLGHFCALMSICRFGMAFWYGVKLIIVNSVQAFPASGYKVGSALFAMGAGVDGIIAVSLLWHHLTKKDGAFPHVTRFVDKFISWTVCTGLLTSIGTVTVIIFQRHMGSTLVWIAASFITAQFYAMSLMTVLNARPTQRSGAPIGSSIEQGNRIPRQRPTSGITASHAVQFAMPSFPHTKTFDHGRIEEEGEESKAPSLSTPEEDVDKKWN